MIEWLYLKLNSHEAMRIMEKPRMDKKRKFLYSFPLV